MANNGTDVNILHIMKSEYIAHSQLNIMSVLGILLFSSNFAFAGNSTEEISRRAGIGDPVAGKEKSILCQKCHGEDGNSTDPNFPKLAGQYSDYIQRQINNYRTGTRSDPDMNKVASTLMNTKDLSDIGAYFASQKQMTGTPTENKVGEQIFQAKGCLNCHGENGKGKPSYNAIFPVIGGQHKDYLVKQMYEFKVGARDTDISGIMGSLTIQMSDTDIEAVSEYISGF